MSEALPIAADTNEQGIRFSSESRRMTSLYGVVAILHGSRNPRVLAVILRSREDNRNRLRQEPVEPFAYVRGSVEGAADRLSTQNGLATPSLFRRLVIYSIKKNPEAKNQKPYNRIIP